MCFVALLLGFACFFWLTIKASTVQIVYTKRNTIIYFLLAVSMDLATKNLLCYCILNSEPYQIPLIAISGVSSSQIYQEPFPETHHKLCNSVNLIH